MFSHRVTETQRKSCLCVSVTLWLNQIGCCYGCLCERHSAILGPPRYEGVRLKRTLSTHTCRRLTQAGPPAGWFYRGGSCMCRWLALSVSVFGLSSSLVLAQIGSATLTGRVTDPSGAV